MNFLGYELKGAVIAASCPATESLENVMACAKNGAAAIILKSASGTRLGDNKTRRCFIDHMGFWSESGFDREILPLETATALTSSAIKNINVPVIPSVTEMTLTPGQWLESCSALEMAGAHALQLDFFYFPNLLSKDDFAVDFIRLLLEINTHCRIPVMPKLNISLPAEYAVYLLKKAGIEYVSLLDSIRSPAPDGAYLSGRNLSVFGTYMLPLTRQYTSVLSKAGFSVCAGGGITNAEQAADLIRIGAKTVQIATEVLLNGFMRFGEIDCEIPLCLSLQNPQPAIRSRKVVFNADKCTCCGRCKTQVFCSVAKKLCEDNYECEGCGLCASLCLNHAIVFK